jgi:hypothetical protein
MRAIEKTIALQAVQVFRDATGLDAQYQKSTKGDPHSDGIVCIRNGNQTLEFPAEIKRRINRAIVGLVHQQMLNVGQVLLVTDYVNPEMANALKSQGIPFIDASGNAFINAPPLYVFIRGNKPIEKFRGDRTKRLFKPSGLRVLFTLLNNPGAENYPYRDIAAEAGVAIGTVNWVVYDLKETGFMVDLGKKGRRLINKANLLRRWVEAYPEQLKPKLIHGTFKVDTRNWWKNIELAEYGAFWGGETAAAQLTGYLKPERFIIYADRPPEMLVFKHKLQKDPQGNLEILKSFWTFKWKTAEMGIVPPLLVYADLMATADTRNIEAAEMIYEDRLAGLVRED